MKRCPCISTLLLMLVFPTVQGEQPLCPEGHEYRCSGGINGVSCNCVDTSIEECLIFDFGGGAAPGPGPGGVEVVLSANIPAGSVCHIDYTLNLTRFDATSSETIPLTNGSLSGAAPNAIVPASFTSSMSPRQQYRVSGGGEAHECKINEFLSFEIVTSTIDATGAPAGQTSARTNFTRMDDEHTPPDRPVLPAIVVPNNNTSIYVSKP